MANLDEPVVSTPPKWLRKLVYIMGIILLLLFFGLVAGIIYKANHKAEVVVPEAHVLDIGLLPDDKFTDVVLNGDRLTINAGRIIYVIDVRTNHVILRVNGVQD
jgi:hypothetical protein